MEVLFALWGQPSQRMLIEPSERSCKNRNKTKKGCASVANRPRFGRGKPAGNFKVEERRTEEHEEPKRPKEYPPSALWTSPYEAILRAATASVSNAQELCESRGGRPGLLSLINLRFLWT